MGGFDELAWRAQLLLEPTESFSALLNVHGRDNDGTSSIFRANVLGPATATASTQTTTETKSLMTAAITTAGGGGHRVAQDGIRL
jgi:hypothetical protein